MNSPLHRRKYSFAWFYLVFVTISGYVFGESAIRIWPSATVSIGQEVVFDGSLLTNETLNKLPNGMIRGYYSWDFGDGYCMDLGSPESTSRDTGVSVSHFFILPGSYNVRLTIHEILASDETTKTGRTISDTITVTVAGQYRPLPPLVPVAPTVKLDFDNTLNDSSGNNLHASWSNGQGSFENGMYNKAVAFNGSSIEIPDNPFLEGMDQFTITFWARKTSQSPTSYTVMEKTDAYRLDVEYYRTIQSYVVTGGKKVWSDANNTVYNIDNTIWHHYALVYNGSSLCVYMDGSKCQEKPAQGQVANTSSPLKIQFNGLMDDFRLYRVALTQNQIFQGFDVERADYHGHTSQYLNVLIPDLYTNDSANTLQISLANGAGSPSVIYSKNNLHNVEKVLFKQTDLSAGAYKIQYSIQNGTNELSSFHESFVKPVDGIPVYGIDENNSIRLEGKHFFPVTSWIQRYDNASIWADRNVINALYGQGWHQSGHTISAFRYYLDLALSKNLRMIGPTSWQGQGLIHFERNSNTQSIIDYVNAFKNHQAIMSWMWDDEPTLGSDAQHNPPQVVRSYTALCHAYDPSHLVTTNFAGKAWTEEAKAVGRRPYNQSHNAVYLGGKNTAVADILGFDYYPVDWRILHNATVEKLVIGIDNLRTENPYVPIMSFVETANIKDDVGVDSPSVGTPPATPEQLRMIIWLSVVHGVKGINWFQQFTDTSQENFVVMQQFVDQITRLSPVVLGPDTTISVTDSADIKGNRVDTMVREFDNDIYIFAVRLSEILESNNPAISVSFTIKGYTNSTVKVFDENRQIPLSQGAFTDTFNPNDVHIYIIPSDHIASNIRENQLSIIELTPTDLAGNPISFSPTVYGLPKRASFNTATNFLSWRPWYDQAGSYELLFSAVGNDYIQRVTIDVEDVLLKTWYQNWLESTPAQEAMVEY